MWLRFRKKHKIIYQLKNFNHDIFEIKSNLSEKEIDDAYKNGSDMLEFDFKEKCIAKESFGKEYTLFFIHEREYKRLEAHGLYKKFIDFPKWDSQMHLFLNGLNLNNNSYAYLQLYLFVAMLGNSKLRISDIKEVVGYEI